MLETPAFHLGTPRYPAYDAAFGHKIQGRGLMFEQTLGGTLRNLAIGLVLTVAVVGAAFALAFA